MLNLKMIPYGLPYMEHSGFLSLLKNVFSGKVQEGPSIEEFERRFAKYVGTKYAVTFASARAGLYLAYKFFKCDSKKVVLPSYTCSPAIDATRWAGAVPYFLDIDLNSYNPKFDNSIIKLKNIGAISLSYLYGLMGDVKPFLEFSRENNIPIIEDAAIALGACYKNKKAGSLGNIGVFSLQESKIISGWRGGVVTTSDPKVYEYMIKERSNMIRISSFKVSFNLSFSYLRRLCGNPYIYRFTMHPLKQLMTSKYFVSSLGRIMNFNPIEALNGMGPEKVPHSDLVRFTNAQAEVALDSLKRIDMIVEKRKRLAKILFRELAKEKRVSFPKEGKDIKHVYGRIPLRIEGVNKFKLKRFFLKNGIEIAFNYPYITPNTYFMKKYSFNEKDYPNAKIASKETFLLPFHPYLNENDVLDMAQVVKRFLKQGST